MEAGVQVERGSGSSADFRPMSTNDQCIFPRQPLQESGAQRGRMKQGPSLKIQRIWIDAQVGFGGVGSATCFSRDTAHGTSNGANRAMQFFFSRVLFAKGCALRTSGPDLGYYRNQSMATTRGLMCGPL